MDHESTGLTETERRILAEIEDGLLHQRRTLWGPRRRRPGPPSTRARTIGWRVVTVVGSTVLAGGLVAGAVWAAAAGYLVVFLALSVLTAGATPARCLARLRRLISLDVEPVRRTN